MGKGNIAATVGLLLAMMAGEAGAEMPAGKAEPRHPPGFAQAQRSCSAARTCREAVAMWCNGYEKADRDRDGIPCETICPNKELVDRIRQEIGC